MDFEIEAEGVDAERLRRAILDRIEAKKGDLCTEEELQALAERGLEAVLRAGELRGALLEEFKARDGEWNFSFDPETVYRSSRGRVGRALRAIRRLLSPVQRLFWNVNPMISALSRQSELNRYYVHLLHNLVLEVSRLNLEVQELRNRNLQLSGRVEWLARRGKTLEEMLDVDAQRDGPEEGSGRRRR
jgi:hypothetical protein